MKLYHLIKPVGLITLSLFFMSETFAYERWGCRYAPNNSYTFNANPTGFAGQYSKWLDSFDVGASRMYKGASFYVYSRLDNDDEIGVGNGESEIWWSTSGCSATAYGTTDSGGCAVIEADIHYSVNDCLEWDDDMSDKTIYRNYGPDVQRTFETTTIHEVGHTAGLAHENDEYNIMGSDYTTITANGPSLRSYISEDMNEGLIAIYPDRNIADLSATHWKYSGADGEYSEHERTKVYDSNGNVLPSANHAGCYTQDKVEHCEKIYTVSIGQQIQAEFLYENNGNGERTASIGYYISDNDTITTSDTLIATDSITTGPYGVANARKKTLTLPSDLSPNTTYFIGTIVDHTDSLNEDDEQNNASYLPIKTSSGGSSSGGSSSGGSSSGGSSSGGSSSSSGGELSNGVPVYNLSASDDERLYFFIDVPAGASNLYIRTDGGSGDSDMYVKFGSVPTFSDYDCRPYGGGNGEWCGDDEDPLVTQQGRYHIMLHAYEAFSGMSLEASYEGGSGSSGGSSSGGSSSGGSSSGGGHELDNGRSVGNLSANEGDYTITFYLDVPSGASNLKIEIAGDSGSTGDADLYVKKGSEPTDSDYDCRPYKNGNQEICGVGGNSLPTSQGRFYIKLKAYRSFNNVRLTGSYSGGG